MNRTDKEAIIAEVNGKATRASAMYVADFTGLTVAEETDLRREFRKSGIVQNPLDGSWTNGIHIRSP